MRFLGRKWEKKISHDCKGNSMSSFEALVLPCRTVLLCCKPPQEPQCRVFGVLSSFCEICTRHDQAGYTGSLRLSSQKWRLCGYGPKAQVWLGSAPDLGHHLLNGYARSLFQFTAQL